MENFTIHIFGYGETQINSSEFSIKVKTDSLTKVSAVVSAIFAKKPAENHAIIDKYHAINIFSFNDIRWMDKTGFSLKNEIELKPIIEELILELKTAFDALPKP